MVWARIPPERLEHLSLFGYDFITDDPYDDAFAWYHGPLGRTRIEKANPRVWFEDPSEAVQGGATSIVQVDDGKQKKSGKH